jgi:release factor glutamine methyltransferase
MNLQGAAGAVRTIRETLARDASRLAQALNLEQVESRLEVRILLEHVLNVGRAWLLTHDDQEITDASKERYARLLARRLAGEPIAYIVGEREFYGRPFKVGPSVLVPRPETELLVDLALARIRADEPAAVLDLGTGSGCIAISIALERPACKVMGIDSSPSALHMARENARLLKADVEWRQSNWFSGLAGLRFDLIVSNPPYIAERDTHLESGDVRFEPRSALASGPAGLDDLTVIIEQSLSFLKAGGWLLVEHGWNQSQDVADLMKYQGFQQFLSQKDCAGLDRVTLAKCR